MPIVRDFGLFAAVGLVGGLVASIVGCTWGLAYAAVEPSRPADSYLTGVVDRLVRSGLQHPAPVLLGTGLVAAGAVVGIARLEADTNSIRHLFKDHPVRQDSRLIEKTLGPYAPLDFVVAPPDSASVLRPAVFSEVADWTRQARRTGEVGWSRSPVDAVQRLHTALSARSDALPQSTRRLQGLVRLGRGHLPALDELAAHPTQMRVTFGVPVQSADSMAQTIAAVQGAAAGALPGDYRVEATGYLPLYVRIMTLVVESQVRSFGLALLIILGVIGLLFRSVRAALLSIIPNVLPVLLTLGLMGWVGIPLDVATVTISAIVLGLVVDDTVHILHRYLHERQAGRPGPAAMLHGAHRGGRMLTITTTVLGGGFLVLCLAQIKSVVWFGLLSSTAIGLALLTDLLVLPAIVSALHSTSASTAASDPSPVAQEA
jgi:predicted RND superfamily exporter protein